MAAVVWSATAAHSAESPAERDYGRTCLALAIYAEARGEPWAGQEEVGAVVMRRYRIAKTSICAVVFEAGQFEGVESWDPPRVAKDPAAWATAWDVADLLLGDHAEPAEDCAGALQFRVATGDRRALCRIGNHEFFKE
jgi:hypothetical protein